MEKGGIKIKDILTNKNPFPTTKCVEKSCPMCYKNHLVEYGSKHIPCNTNNIGYRWICVTCQNKNVSKIYEGETGRSGRTRFREHLRDLEKERPKSVLFKHKISDHKSESVQFKFEVTGKFKDALTGNQMKLSG